MKLLSYLLVIFVFIKLVKTQVEFLAPYEIKVVSDSEAKDEVGSINLRPSTAQVTYHIRQILEGRKTDFTGNENNINTWESEALDETKDDCSEETLRAYNGLRRLFCLNHQTGKIFVTDFFVQEAPANGKEYSLEIVVKYNGLQITKAYLVKIVDYCDLQRSSYDQAISCSNLTTPEKAKCYSDPTDSTLWKCNVTTPPPFYTMGIELKFSDSTSRTRLESGILLEDSQGSRQLIVLDGVINNKQFTKYYNPSTKPFQFINGTYFQEDISGSKLSLDQQFGIENIEITQLIISDNINTCTSVQKCTKEFNKIDFQFLEICFKDEYFSEFQYDACQGKPPIQLNESTPTTINLPLSESQEIFELLDLTGTSRTFEIISIKGPNLNIGDISVPTLCNSTEIPGSLNYFCINPTSGMIYSAINLKEIESSSELVYEVRFQVIDNSYPITVSKSLMKLTLKDTCIGYTPIQSQLQENNCNIQTQSLSSSSIDSTVMTFDMTSYSINHIIGMSLNSSRIGLISNVSYNYKISFSTYEETFSFTINRKKSFVRFQLPTISDVILNLNISILNGTNQLDLLHDSVALVLASDWSACSKDTCLIKHEEYSERLKNHCVTKDDRYIKAYFQTCQDVKPTFLTGPSVSSNNRLQGCSFTSKIPINVNNTYWLVDNTTKLEVGAILKQKDTDVYSFSELILEDNFDRNASYQCVIDDVLRIKELVFSDEITVTATQLDPEFISNPIISDGYLQGCNYTTNHPFSMWVYWLQNDTAVMQNKTHLSTQYNNETFQLQNLKILNSFDDVSYRCAIYVPGRMEKPVLSESVIVPGQETIPTYISGPKQIGTIIKGCIYQADISLQNYTYWLVNGTTIIYNNETEQTSSTSNNDENVYVFPDVLSTRIIDGSSYQCGIYDPERMRTPLLSEKFFVKLLRPKFINLPIYKEDIGYLTGCEYESTKSLWNHSYWLINGITKSLTNEAPGLKSDKPTVHQFPRLQISNESNDVYQCGIFDPLFMEKPVLSEIFRFIRDPEFKSPPKYTVNSKDQIISLRWCNASNIFPQNVESIYWLKDGIKTVSEKPSTTSIDAMDLIFTEETAYASYGFFQCGIKLKDGQEMLSERIDVQFFSKVVSKTWLEFLISEQWNDEYLKINSSKQIELKEILTKKITTLLHSENLSKNNKETIEVLSFRNGQNNNVMVSLNLLFNKMSTDEILKTCDQIHVLRENGKFDSDGIKLLQQKSFDCCFKDILGDNTKTGVYEFQTTLVSSSNKQQCTYDQTNHIERFCHVDLIQGAYWKDVDVTKCRLKSEQPDTLEEVEKTTICTNTSQSNCSDVTVIAKDLSLAVGKTSELKTEKDLIIVDKIIESITENFDETVQTLDEGEEVLDDVLSCMNIVVASPTHINSKENNQSDSTTEKILKSLDTLTKSVATLLENSKQDKIEISKENVGLKITKIPIDTNDVIVSLNDIDGILKVNISDDGNVYNETASIKIPKEVFKSGQRFMHSFVFRYETLFDPQVEQQRRYRRHTDALKSNEVNDELQVDGKVLSATVGGKKIENLENPIQLKFKKTLQKEGDRNCYFWEFKNNSTGNWSTRGCKYTREDINYVYCECDHLTNFALLLDVSQKGNNPFEMQLVTWIGCGISLFGLLMTIISYGCLRKKEPHKTLTSKIRKLRAKLAPKLLLCLCFSLTMLLIIFVFGAEQSRHKLVCKVIAALIQFFTLSTFFWMAVEAYNLYRCFVQIFKSNLTNTQFLLRTSLLAWGAPLMITLATSFTHPDKLGTKDICIIYGTPFYYGLLLPVSLILFGNFLALYFVITGINDVSKSTSKSRSLKQEKLTRSRIAFTCSLLLGLSWIFAVLAIGDLAEVFQWLFCVFSSLQGFFIFVFYTVKNREVWDEWRKAFGMKPLNEYGSSFKKSSRVGLYATTSNNSNGSSSNRFSFFRRSTYVVDDVFTENKV